MIFKLQRFPKIKALGNQPIYTEPTHGHPKQLQKIKKSCFNPFFSWVIIAHSLSICLFELSRLIPLYSSPFFTWALFFIPSPSFCSAIPLTLSFTCTLLSFPFFCPLLILILNVVPNTSCCFLFTTKSTVSSMRSVRFLAMTRMHCL